MYGLYLAGFEFARFEANPLLGPEPGELGKMGAQTTFLLTCKGEWWRLGASIYAHAGVVHLLTQTFAMLCLGYPIERELGWRDTAIIYLVSGGVGQIASAVFLQVKTL
jgi:membrane associated rhomboid family serine protease